MATKKLYRSDTDRIVAGIIGGIGEYTDIDSTVLRLIFVIVLIFSAVVPGLIVYFLALLIIPQRRGEEAAKPPKEKKEQPLSKEW